MVGRWCAYRFANAAGVSWTKAFTMIMASVFIDSYLSWVAAAAAQHTNCQNEQSCKTQTLRNFRLGTATRQSRTSRFPIRLRSGFPACKITHTHAPLLYPDTRLCWEYLWRTFTHQLQIHESSRSIQIGTKLQKLGPQADMYVTCHTSATLFSVAISQSHGHACQHILFTTWRGRMNWTASQTQHKSNSNIMLQCHGVSLRHLSHRKKRYNINFALAPFVTRAKTHRVWCKKPGLAH